MAAALGGVDAIVFTAGIGENDAALRAEVAAGCRWLGLELDDALNRAGARPHQPAGSRDLRLGPAHRRGADDRPLHQPGCRDLTKVKTSTAGGVSSRSNTRRLCHGCILQDDDPGRHIVPVAARHCPHGPGLPAQAGGNGGEADCRQARGRRLGRCGRHRARHRALGPGAGRCFVWRRPRRPHLPGRAH